MNSFFCQYRWAKSTLDKAVGLCRALNVRRVAVQHLLLPGVAAALRGCSPTLLHHRYTKVNHFLISCIVKVLEALSDEPADVVPQHLLLVVSLLLHHLEERLVHLQVAEAQRLVQTLLLLRAAVDKHQRVPLGLLEAVEERQVLGLVPQGVFDLLQVVLRLAVHRDEHARGQEKVDLGAALSGSVAPRCLRHRSPRW